VTLSTVQYSVLYPGATPSPDTLSTTFNADGSITTVYLTGLTVVTTFPATGQVVETFTAPGGYLHTKTTTFNADGSITEQIT
jgi:hypothetical protein